MGKVTPEVANCTGVWKISRKFLGEKRAFQASPKQHPQEDYKVMSVRCTFAKTKAENRSGSQILPNDGIFILSFRAEFPDQ